VSELLPDHRADETVGLPEAGGASPGDTTAKAADGDDGRSRKRRLGS
jgi:hypothetical protein